ncbi:hypothetical protein [Blastococcus sp. TF02A-35]|uniref:lipopolysaccharide biosynthesis protein n=1 Tax=Blastococcus sp. TF02A-35 TaxID=2559612 RepID=UPI001FD773AF|nr:hypothetical protein [Blastococcus sp. TF02A_35]
MLLSLNLTDFGFGVRAMRLQAEAEAARAAGWIVAIRLATSMTTCLLGWIIWSLIIDLPSWYGIAIGLYLAGENFGDLTAGLILGRGGVYGAAVSILARRAGTVLAFVTLGFGPDEAMSVLALAGFLGYGLGFMFSVRYVDMRLHSWRTFWRGGMRLWGLAGVANLQAADALLVSLAGGVQVAGLYSAPTRYASPLQLVTNVALQLITPRLAARALEDQLQLWNRARLGMYAYLALLAVGAFASPWLVVLLLGEAYQASWPALAAVMLVAGVSGLTQLNNSLVIVSVVPQRLIYASLAAILLGLAITAGGAATVGVWGAACGYLTTAMLLFLASEATRRHVLRDPVSVRSGDEGQRPRKRASP